MSDSYFFMRQTESQLNRILSKITKLENNMATVQEIIVAARAEQDAIKAAVDQTNALVSEVKQLLAANDIAVAQELLDEIQANSAILVAAAAESAELTAAVDAVNGDPQPAPEPIVTE